MPAKMWPGWSSVQGRLTALMLAIALLAAFALALYQRSEARRINAYLAADANEHGGLLDRTLELEGGSLAAVAKDYTYWDEMVQFVQTGNRTWASQNIDEAMGTYRANAVWVFDTTGTLVYAVRDSTLETLLEPLPPGLSVKDALGDNRLCHFFTTGPDGPVEIRGATIHPSDDPDRKTPVRGFFLVARSWSPEYLAELSRLTGKTMRIDPAHDRTKPMAEVARRSGEITFTRPLPGPQGKPELTLTASLRPGWTAVALSSGRGQFAQQTVPALLAIVGLTLVLWLWVTRPLSRLRRSLESGTTETLEPLKHNRTEFGNLAQLVIESFDQKAALIEETTERKQAEGVARQAAQNWQATFDGINDAVCILSPEGTIRQCNAAMARLGRSSPEALVGRPCHEVVHGTPEPPTDCPLVRASASRGRERFDAVVGGRFVEVTVDPLLDETGRMTGAVHVIADVNERKQAEQTTRESEERFRELFESMSSGVAVYETRDQGASFTFKSLNRGGERIDSLRREEVIGHDVQQVFPGIEEFGLLAVLRRVWQTGKPEQHPIGQYKDDRISGWRENYVYKLPSGEVVAVYDDVTARVQAEAALAESELKFRTLFESSNDPMMLLDSEKFLECNEAAMKVFGCSTRDEILGKHPSEVSPPLQADGRESRVTADQWIAAAFRSGRNFFEWLHQRADGTVFPSDVLLTRIDYHGRKVLQATVRDITKRRQAEQALRESEERMRTITDSAKDAIVMMDDSGLVTFWNPAAEATFGYTAEEAVGRKLHEFLAPERFRAAHLNAFPQFQKTGDGAAVGKTLELPASRKDGSETLVELSLSAINIGDKWHSVGIMRDITERKLAEAALAESELKFRTVFESSNDAMMLFDAGKFLDCNAAALRVFGYSTRDEFLGKHPGEVSPRLQADGRESRAAADESIAAAFRDGRNFFEWLHQRADGTVFPADVLLTPLDYHGRRVLQATVRDITPRKLAEVEIAQKNAELVELNKVKNQLLGMAAHDLRNPLSVVSAASTFLLDDMSRNLPEAKRADFLRRINSSSKFMLKLIDDLLDVAKIESGKLDLELKEENLCGLIEDSLTLNRMLADKKSIRLDFTPECGLPPLRFDRGKVEQVLNNLFSNAIKFSAPGTVVVVQASRVNGSVVVSVRDQGQGIPAEELDKLFKPFGKTSVQATAGESSTGLGLAICRKIVEGHGGRIWAESEIGKGSIFSFSLPVASDDRSQAPKPPAAETPNPKLQIPSKSQ